MRKRYLENIVVAGAWNFEELHSIRSELCQGSPHFRGGDVVRFSMKDANLRHLLLGQNRFQRSHVVELVSKKRPQTDVNLVPNHIVHRGEGRNQDNLANIISGCELEGGGSSERVDSIAAASGDSHLHGAVRILVYV